MTVVQIKAIERKSLENGKKGYLFANDLENNVAEDLLGVLEADHARVDANHARRELLAAEQLNRRF